MVDPGFKAVEYESATLPMVETSKPTKELRRSSRIVTRADKYVYLTSNNQHQWHTEILRGRDYTPAPNLDTNYNKCLSIVESPMAPQTPVKIQIPKTYQEAVNGDHSAKWLEAISTELKAIDDNNTWTLVDKPNRKTIKSKWVFDVKFFQDGTIDKFKARVVAKGFTQVKGIDYRETFAPTLPIKSIRAMTYISAKNNFTLYKYDFSTAFLNSHLKEEIYMEPPIQIVQPKCNMKIVILGLLY